MATRFNRSLGTATYNANVPLEIERMQKLKKYAKQERKSVCQVLRDRVADWVDTLEIKTDDD